MGFKELMDKLYNAFKQNNDKKEEKKVNEEKAKFENMNYAEQQAYLDKKLGYDDSKLLKLIEKEPHILPYIMNKIEDRDYTKLIDVATKKGVNVLDLVGKNENISDITIVNIAVKNQPHLLYSNELVRKNINYKDLITSNTLEEIFYSDAGVPYCDCKNLQATVYVDGVKQDGTKVHQKSTLRDQLLAAIRLHMRPKLYKDNGFYNYAKKIADKIKADKIKEDKFDKSLFLIMSTSITATNEILAKYPEKGKSASSSSLHIWNNRGAHKLPALAMDEKRRSKALEESKRRVMHDRHNKILTGLLTNPAFINSFTEKEKISVIRHCIKACPDLYFELASFGHGDEQNLFEIRRLTYHVLKEDKKVEEQKEFAKLVGEKEMKKILAYERRIATRKANQKAKAKAAKEAEKELELK